MWATLPAHSLPEHERSVMKTTSIQPMKCQMASEGMLRIDRISAGIGVIIFNRVKRVAVGLHVMRGESRGRECLHPIYYTDTAIPHALSLLEDAGVGPPFSVAIAGGASLLGGGIISSVGATLADVVKAQLTKSGLTVKLVETGGSQIRSIVLDIDHGKIKIV